MTEGHILSHREILHPNGKIKSNLFKCLCTQNLDEQLLTLLFSICQNVVYALGARLAFVADGKLQPLKFAYVGLFVTVFCHF